MEEGDKLKVFQLDNKFIYQVTYDLFDSILHRLSKPLSANTWPSVKDMERYGPRVDSHFPGNRGLEL